MSIGTKRRQVRGISDNEWAAFMTAVVVLFNDHDRSATLRRYVREVVAKHTGLTPPADENAPWPELERLMDELRTAETTTPEG